LIAFLRSLGGRADAGLGVRATDRRVGAVSSGRSRSDEGWAWSSRVVGPPPNAIAHGHRVETHETRHKPSAGRERSPEVEPGRHETFQAVGERRGGGGGRGSTAANSRGTPRPVDQSQGFLELLPLPPPNQSNFDLRLSGLTAEDASASARNGTRHLSRPWMRFGSPNQPRSKVAHSFACALVG
jgi:hypothetical protein